MEIMKFSGKKDKKKSAEIDETGVADDTPTSHGALDSLSVITLFLSLFRLISLDNRGNCDRLASIGERSPA